ncbi:MAG: putative dsRNA-binding protein [Opitutales bacterium]|nr:putative dsRNA-binding protein [Opitutales bacterium]
MDSDCETARELTLKYYGPLSSKPAGSDKVANPKGALQEFVQPRYGNFALKYELLSQTGQPHDREFEIAVLCNGEQLGTGKGRSKKEAEEKAAIEAVAILKSRE